MVKNQLNNISYRYTVGPSPDWEPVLFCRWRLFGSSGQGLSSPWNPRLENGGFPPPGQGAWASASSCGVEASWNLLQADLCSSHSNPVVVLVSSSQDHESIYVDTPTFGHELWVVTIGRNKWTLGHDRKSKKPYTGTHCCSPSRGTNAEVAWSVYRVTRQRFSWEVVSWRVPPGRDPREGLWHAGVAMSLCWPENALRSSWKSWRMCPGRGKPACLCSDWCPCDLDTNKWKKMNGWMDHETVLELIWVFSTHNQYIALDKIIFITHI